MSAIIIEKSNYFAEASDQLSIGEKRLILSAILKLNERKQIGDDNEFTITATEFSESFHIPLSQAYAMLEDAASQLYEMDIKIYDNSKKIRERFRLVSGIKLWYGEGKVTLSFSCWAMPYLTLLHQQLTKNNSKDKLLDLNSG